MNRRELLESGTALLLVLVTPTVATAVRRQYTASELNSEVVEGRHIVDCDIVCDEGLILVDGDVFDGCRFTCKGGTFLCASGNGEAMIRGGRIFVSSTLQPMLFHYADGTPLVRGPTQVHTMTLYIRPRFGGDAVTRADGAKFRDEIVPLLLEGAVVTLDFEGVGVVATPIADAAIGDLLLHLPADHLTDRYVILNLSDDASHLLTRVITQAKCALDDMEARALV